jgi:hypothetical protein
MFAYNTGVIKFYVLLKIKKAITMEIMTTTSTFIDRWNR